MEEDFGGGRFWRKILEEDLHEERQHEGQKVGVDCRQSELGK